MLSSQPQAKVEGAGGTGPQRHRLLQLWPSAISWINFFTWEKNKNTILAYLMGGGSRSNMFFRVVVSCEYSPYTQKVLQKCFRKTSRVC